MASRLQVDSGLRPQRIRPTAAPTDPFARSNAGEELAQLARGLQEISPSLGRFAQVLHEREAQEQIARGAQRARELEEQRVTLRDAIKQGLIKPSENPWFLIGAKQQFGRAAAGQYARALQAAVAADPELQATDDPAAFDQFEAEFRKQWLTDNVGDNRDLHFEKGFGIVDGYAMDEARRFTAQVGARIEKLAGERLGIIVGQVLDQHYKEGADVAAQLVTTEIQSYLADNPRAGRIANKRAIEAIADWARVNYKNVGREDVEKLLRGVKAGPGSSLFGLPDAKKMLTDVEKDIISLRGAAANLQHNEEVRAQQQAEKSFWSEVSATLAQAMQNDTLAGADLTPFMQRLAQIDPSPDAPAKLLRLRDSLLQSKGNPEAFREALMWAHGVSEARPGQFLTVKQLASYAAAEGLTGQEFNAVLTEIQQREQAEAEGAAGRGSKLLNDPMVNAGEELIRSTMIDLYGTNLAGNRIASANAIADFRMAVLRDPTLKGLDPVKRFERLDALARTSLRLHAPEHVLKAQNKAGEVVEQNERTLGVFEEVMKRASDADAPLINRALREYKNKSPDTDFSPETGALLFRLGVPLNDKDIKSFFIEWERRNQ